MKVHRCLLLVGLALPALTHARIWHDGNPPGLRDGVSRPTLEVRGWISGFKLTGRHGKSVEVRLPRPAPLDEALRLPAGDWSDLELRLSGPLTVGVDGGPDVSLWVESLTVPLEDPEAGQVLLCWSLPEGAVSALAAGVVPADAARLLEDGAVAEPRVED